MTEETEDIELTWSFELKVNTTYGWREKVGMALRYMADDIDGRKTLAIEISSLPPISKDARHYIIDRGVKHMKALLEAEAGSEAHDSMFEIVHPELDGEKS